MGGAFRRRHLGPRASASATVLIIYMPMVPEAMVAMLACARLGAVHSVVFGGFASNELAVRIDDAQATVVVSASCGIEVNRVVPYKPLLDGALDLAKSKPGRCIILQRPEGPADLTPGRDVDWAEAMAQSGARRLRAGGGDRPSLHPLHFRHDGRAQGRDPRHRWLRGGAQVVHEERLQCRPGRRVLGGVRRRLGGRPLLHRLRAPAPWLHFDPVRGQAGGHPRRRRLLAGDRRASGELHGSRHRRRSAQSSARTPTAIS